MTKNQRILAHVLLEIGPNEQTGLDALKAALRSAIQVGLNAQVQELSIYQVAYRDMSPNGNCAPPHSEPSARDQVVEEYFHSGMLVEIYRDAGSKTPPTYFAVVVNPQVKSPTGTVIEAASYAELKKAAEARAERKAFLFQKKQANLQTPSS